MGVCEKFIKKLETTLPELCTVKDLIKANLYKSPQAARSARMAHTSPDFIQPSARQIFYPRDGVIEWLQKGINEGWNSSNHEITSQAEKVEDVYKTARLDADCE